MDFIVASFRISTTYKHFDKVSSLWPELLDLLFKFR
jgi:hypothetical protein